MKLYLFGGAETDQGQAPILKQLINKVIEEIKPKQLLHIPYARIKIPKGEENIWGEGWVPRDLNLDGIELLDARNKEDLTRTNKPIIFMNGGPQRDHLYEQIVQNKRLYDLVMNSDFIIGESAGLMVCAEYRSALHKNKYITKKGLGIVKSTIVEAHYTEKNRQQLLRDEMKETGALFGIGIDSIAGIVINTETYPDGYQIIGNGLVEFVRKEDFE